MELLKAIVKKKKKKSTEFVEAVVFLFLFFLPKLAIGYWVELNCCGLVRCHFLSALCFGQLIITHGVLMSPVLTMD